jgi:transcriptional regulator with XRE-family HTH domain
MSNGKRTSSLRDARLRAGLTQQELSWACGVNVITISRAERGKQWPRHATLRRMAAVLDTTIDELVPSMEENDRDAEQLAGVGVPDSQKG